jgi:hypothetical protein
MKKRMMTQLRHGWFFWIGGACFLVGSLVAGSVGIASSATSGSPPVNPLAGPTVNQGAAGSSPWPVTASGNVGLSGSLPAGSNNIGNVGLSGSLPAGTNNIGTVHVATPASISGQKSCTVADVVASCITDDLVIAAGTVVNTLSVRCETAPGHHVAVAYDSTGGLQVDVPLTFQASFANGDVYSGTLTNLGIPQGGFFDVIQDYAASSSNGTSCEMTYIGTTS